MELAIKFSMNGFRRQLSDDVQELANIVKTVIAGDFYEHEDLVDAINKIITHSNVMNCLHSEEDPDFRNISDLEIEHLDISERSKM